jgi:SAM-dependent methyltransferase
MDALRQRAHSQRGGLNVWTAYRLGLRLKTNTDGSAGAVATSLGRMWREPQRLSRALSPIDLVRWREFDFALRAVHRHAPGAARVLDISSPKLLPLALAAWLGARGQVCATDILQKEVDWVRGAADRLGLTNVECQVQDARRLPHPSGSFDLVTSISVFEHIAPEQDGEIPAVREMARVLAPGGTGIITVPFARRYFADYVTSAAYERDNPAGQPIFFQRFYDHHRLGRVFVESSGLQALSIRFVEERYFLSDPRKRLAHYVNGSARQQAWFGPLYPLIAHLFLSPPRSLEACGAKPYIACLVLRKPTEPTAQ